MQLLSRNTQPAKKYTEKVIQFGEGNFLRGFADWMIHQMNKKGDFDAGVVIVQPIEKGMAQMLNDQDGLYTVLLNGLKEGKPTSDSFLVDCVQRAINPYTQFSDFFKLAEMPSVRFIFSNTTEAGIAYHSGSVSARPPQSFPAKLTVLLKRRFDFFDGDIEKGLYIIPCELIEQNGDKLKEIILKYVEEWQLGVAFRNWLLEACSFCNTLVDRIVPGFPKDRIGEIHEKLGYEDRLVVEGEQFGLWVIQGDEALAKEFPAPEYGLNVVFTDDIAPYRTRKVRILNGAHTAMVPIGLLSEIEFVREAVEDEAVGNFIEAAIFEEIIPTIDLPQEELESFATEVIQRFKNPFLKHALMSISLNSISKFKTRVLPTILDFHEEKGELPKRLVYAFSALLVFYKGEISGKKIPLKDSEEVLTFATETWGNAALSTKEKVKLWLAKVDFWGMDLSTIEGFETLVQSSVESILKEGIRV